jgi:hypothetical protein
MLILPLILSHQAVLLEAKGKSKFSPKASASCLLSAMLNDL